MSDERVQWVSHPSFLRCRNGHRLHAEERHARLDVRADGLVYTLCRRCNPASWALFVVTTLPTPWASAWSLNRSEYEQLSSLPNDLTVIELLTLLHVVEGQV